LIKEMKKRSFASLLLAFLLILLYSLPVFALTNPTSVNIVKTHAVNNVLVTGDILIMAEYDITFAANPTELVDSTFIFQLIAADGVTELGRVLAYPYVTRGYGKGVISFYFAVNPITANYSIIRILGNPIYFTPAYSQDFPLSATTYTATANTTDADIALQVKTYVADLNPTYYPALGDYLTSTVTGITTTLSSVGTIYFTNAIPNLRNMSPSLFDVEIYAPTATVDTYNTTQADAYKNRFVGTWVGNSAAAFGNLLGTGMQISMGVLVLLICVLWAVAAVGLTGQAQAGFLPMVSTLLAGTLLGFVSMAVNSIIVFLAALYLGMVLIFKGVQA
jgi:hypothetical protein